LGYGPFSRHIDGFSEKGANTSEILEYAKMTKAKVEGTLGDYI